MQVDVNGNIVWADTPATSVETGAIVVPGGVGIGQDLWVGGDIHITGELFVAGANLEVAAVNVDFDPDNSILTAVEVQGAIDELAGIVDADGSATTVQSNLNAHIADDQNPHSVTADQVGLGNVDNTSDLDKPVSNLTSAALNTNYLNSIDRANHTGSMSADFLVDGTNAKVFRTADETKLDNIEAGADITDAFNVPPALAAATSISPEDQESIRNNIGVASGTDVTLSGSYDYLEIVGPNSIQLNGINLVTDVIGNLSADRVIDGTTNHVFTAADDARLANTSGTNTGDNATNTQYHWLIADAVHSTKSIFQNGDVVNGTGTGISIELGISGSQSGAIALKSSGGGTSLIQASSVGNLQLSSEAGAGVFLNFYSGDGTFFGDGASTVVAVMGPDGDLWKGSTDNSGSKYWHAGNDGPGSGLNADLLDGLHAADLAPVSHTHPLSEITDNGTIAYQDYDSVSITGGNLDSVTFSGVINFNDTTDASTTTTGAVVIDGGLGVAKSIRAGGIVYSKVALATDNALVAGTQGDAAATFTVQGDGALNWGSGSASRDTKLFRNSAGYLSLDGGLIARKSSGTETALATRIDTDTISRFVARADGSLHWGDGTNATDVSLERTGPETLQLNGSLVAEDPEGWTTLGIYASATGRAAQIYLRGSATPSTSVPAWSLGQRANDHGNFSLWRYTTSHHDPAATFFNDDSLTLYSTVDSTTSTTGALKVHSIGVADDVVIGDSLKVCTDDSSNFIEMDEGWIKVTKSDENFAVLMSKVSGDSENRFRIEADGELEWGGGSSVGDVYLKRANDESLETNAYIASTGKGIRVWTDDAAGTDTVIFGSRSDAESYDMFQISAGGELKWGSGASTTRDVFLSRDSGGSLTQTNDSGSTNHVRYILSASGTNDYAYTRWSAENGWWDAGAGGSAVTLAPLRDYAFFNLGSSGLNGFRWADNGSTKMTLSRAGDLSLTSTTDSTSPTTGALTVHSLGVADDLYVGESIVTEGGRVRSTSSGWAGFDAETTSAGSSAAIRFITPTTDAVTPTWFIGHRYSDHGPLAFWQDDGTGNQANSMELGVDGVLTIPGGISTPGVSTSDTIDIVRDVNYWTTEYEDDPFIDLTNNEQDGAADNSEIPLVFRTKNSVASTRRTGIVAGGTGGAGSAYLKLFGDISDKGRTDNPSIQINSDDSVDFYGQAEFNANAALIGSNSFLYFNNGSDGYIGSSSSNEILLRIKDDESLRILGNSGADKLTVDAATGAVEIVSTVNSTSSTTGALKVHSIGVADDLYVGDDLDVSGASSFRDQIARRLSSASDNAFFVVQGSNSYSHLRIMGDGSLQWSNGTDEHDTILRRIDPETLQLEGSLYLEDPGGWTTIQVTPNAATRAATIGFNHYSGIGASTPSWFMGQRHDANGPLNIWRYTGSHLSPAFRINTDDTISVLSTAAASSSTTGALKVAGGVGIADDLYVGDNANIADDLTVGGTAYVDVVSSDAAVSYLRNTAVGGNVIIEQEFSGNYTRFNLTREIAEPFASIYQSGATNGICMLQIGGPNADDFISDNNPVNYVSIEPTYNQDIGNHALTDLLINRTETNIGSGAQYFIDAQISGSSVFSVTNSGIISSLGPLTVTRAANNLDLIVGNVTGDTNPRFVIDVDGQLNWGGGTSSTDCKLWRFAANNLYTDSGIHYTRDSSASSVAVSRVTGDSDWRYMARIDGTLEWGTGSTSRDTFLERTAHGTLRLSATSQPVKLLLHRNDSSGTAHDVAIQGNWADQALTLSVGSTDVLYTSGVDNILHTDIQFSVEDVTQSTSVSTGSIVTDGGIGVAKNAWIGGQLNVAGDVGFDGDVTLDGEFTQYAANGLTSEMTLKGDHYITLTFIADADSSTGGPYEGAINLNGSTGSMQFYTSPSGVGTRTIRMSIDKDAGDIKIYSMSASTDSNSGAVTVAGGVGVLGSIYAGANIITESGFFGSVNDSSTDQAFTTSVDGDGFGRFRIQADGEMGWGPGGTTRDIFLERSAAGELTYYASGGNTAVRLESIYPSNYAFNRYMTDGGSLYVGTAGTTVSYTALRNKAYFQISDLDGWIWNDVSSGQETVMELTQAGVLTVAKSIASTSPTTGSIVSAGGVGITGDVHIDGTLYATAKSFVIDHPTKPNKKLHHGVVEGPEHSVYVRGRTKKGRIELPEYWKNLVDEDTITVQLTPIKHHQHLIVVDFNSEFVDIQNKNVMGNLRIDCFYYIQAERKDIPKVKVEE